MAQIAKERAAQPTNMAFGFGDPRSAGLGGGMGGGGGLGGGQGFGCAPAPPELTAKLAAALDPGSFFSPASLQLAVALVAGGAAGRTLAEVQHLFGWPVSGSWQVELAARFSKLAADEPVVAVANRCYVRGVDVKPDYKRTVLKHFRSTLEALASAAEARARAVFF